MKHRLPKYLAIIALLAVLSIPISFVGAVPPAVQGHYWGYVSTPQSCIAYMNCGWTLSCIGDAISCYGDLQDPYLMY